MYRLFYFFSSSDWSDFLNTVILRAHTLPWAWTFFYIFFFLVIPPANIYLITAAALDKALVHCRHGAQVGIIRLYPLIF